MSTAHAERAHALLSASGSKRWLTCTPSAQLETEFPDQTSEFAEEGTFAHELSEIHLMKYIGQISKSTATRRLNKKKKGEWYSEEMADYVQVYVDHVIERINEAKAKTKDAVISIEQRLDFSAWVPDGFGTGDVVIVADGVLEVIDLKYGKGVPVFAEDNSQARLYALGALTLYGFLYDIETVRMTIVQPRLDSISTDEMAVDSLIAWADEVVKPRAEMAINGEGEFVAGDHCRFCKARSTCRKRAEENLELARHDFKDSKLLSTEEVAEVLAKVSEIQKWAEDVKKYALDQAENHGVKYPGYKLVEGRSNRKYKNEEAVAKALLEEGYEKEKIYNKSLLTLSKMEKEIGKKAFGQVLGDLVIKPVGKPTLAPVSDKRPEINSTDSAVADFK
ncbi:DUF2800 domain-containing protein [Bacillus sp. SCS-151]|uniref:DUF2800 domain-containing protein n=1 Tax=Nanhaiella sioensis TaxID=3115293 RepID=UPI00397978E4